MNIKTILPAFVIFLPVLSESAMGSVETWICLNNTTPYRKLILVEDIDNKDWDGLSRPDHNWNGTYVEAGATRCERAEINSTWVYGSDYTNSAFGFIINGRTSQQKVRMQVLDVSQRGKVWGFYVFGNNDPSSFILKFKRSGSVSTSYYELGAECTAGKNCALFTIQDVP